MPSTNKVAFNIDGLTIHLTLNMFIQQSLFSLHVNMNNYNLL
jgi:hypothetical protein